MTQATNTQLTPSSPSKRPRPAQPLRGVRVLSLALNLPGPAALMRLQAMGARCQKVEQPAAGPDPSAPTDPMGLYNPCAYAQMHQSVKLLRLNLKSPAGQTALHKALARSDVLLTSFRPSALKKLGLGWTQLHRQHPQLSMVCVVGAPGAAAEAPGHDLTYLASAGLIDGLALPPTLFADMGGALMASEAVLQAVLLQKTQGLSSRHEVALSDAAEWLALPRQWGLTQPHGAVGGAHAGYRIYPCRDGRVAVAALEPHFASALFRVAGLPDSPPPDAFQAHIHQALAAFLSGQTRHQLECLAEAHDIPLHTLAHAQAGAPSDAPSDAQAKARNKGLPKVPS